ncbi:MAG: SDR family NAD(P)-dependent oxidoreductase, partial [Bacteroidota bacterium]|nr:SDR family NAD(P)-dependent oxidoreductase [Bacteroidota bacterium]
MVFDLFNLKGRIALVTGATHGLGMAMATGLAQAGATLVINSSSDQHLAEALSEYKKAGVEAKGYVFDVANEAEVIET